MKEKILITGAAGNLGSLLAARLLEQDSLPVRLMFHRKPLPDELQRHPLSETVRADLGDSASLRNALAGISVVVHFAGVLFRHHPEKFLPVTNTLYFKNLLDASLLSGVKRLILISFPHVEGETTPEYPAQGHIKGKPSSVHARTRLEEEKILLQVAESYRLEAIILRVGMVYASGILMIEGARWFARRRMLGVWRKPTMIHLISLPDFLEAASRAVQLPGISGIYHVGDEGQQSLQEFLDAICQHWGYHKPWRMPLWLIMTAAWHFELFSLLFGTRSPLTRDFVRIGTSSYYGDTGRMRQELLPKIEFPTFKDGINIL